MYATKQHSLIKAIRGIGSSDLSKRPRDSDSNFETFLNIKRNRDYNQSKNEEQMSKIMNSYNLLTDSEDPYNSLPQTARHPFTKAKI